ncbi:MAG: DNA mismatch repair protein MutS2 [Dehalococcoidia bacterium]|nr:DNA mismatch repair protein MutS2 [Dehalococcoidia bacterium]
MDAKSLELLEFPQIKKILAGFTSFSASRQLALGLQPAADYQQVALLLRQSAEARNLLSIKPGFTIGGVQDIRQEAKMASVGKILTPQSLLDIQNTLTAFGQVHNTLKGLSAQMPLLWNIAADLMAFNEIATKIGYCLSPDGEVLDRASAHLANVRRQLVELRQQLRQQLEATMNTPRGREIIQEPFIVERDGRFVIPIKIEYRKEMKGIVHDVSNTGATLYIEPLAMVELGNTIREMTVEEKREVDRILQSLSGEIGKHEEEISSNIARIAELDLVLAKARYAHKIGAVEPALTGLSDDNEAVVTGTPRILKLANARHPLLGVTAVPLTVEIGRDFSVLVITGPNTGGKTVAIKTIGLLSLMTQSGIPIPASDGSQIPIFDGIFADIGDEQSIAQTLSSFSWHMGNVVRIINQATKKSLVLLDELGTSTDPVEGSSLAIAILHHFLSRRTMTVATTHFSEVKAFAHTTDGMQNASFDFDPKTLSPTYHLTIGTPGGSNALAIASRLGLPQEVIAEAQRLVPETRKQLETILDSLRIQEQEITALRDQLEKKRDEAIQQSEELETERQQCRVDISNMIQQARDTVTSEVAGLRRQVREAESELRKQKSRERLEQVKKAITTVAEQLKSEVLQSGDAVTDSTPNKESISIGDTAWLKEVGIKATVLSVSEERQEVEVQAGQTRIILGLEEIEKVTSPDGQPSVEYTQLSRGMTFRPVSRELDLRGKRASEIEMVLDGYLNDAAMANQAEVRIIHGFGTGTVRQIVRDFLATHPLVKSFRAGKRGEGGDGATVVQL